MKLPFSRIFDTGLVAKEKAFTELAPFIEWIQNVVDVLYRALSNNISIGDNLDAQFFTFRIKPTSSSHSTTIALRKRPRAVFLARQNPTTPGVSRPLTWEIDQSGQTLINLTFSTVPTTAIEITVLAFFS